jgi:hypothetical protein
MVRSGSPHVFYGTEDSMLSIRSFLRALRRPVALLGGAALVVGLTGCPDPNGSYDDFVVRAGKIPPPPPGECGQTVLSVDGDFFFALSSQLAKKKPITFLAKLSTDAGGLSMNLQALEKVDRKTPVGPAVDVGPYPIVDGNFTATLPTLQVPGAANPISPADIEAQITLVGSVCEDFICGTVEGQVTKPAMIALDPENSRFTMERVITPGDYPEPPQINCAGDLADPL